MLDFEIDSFPVDILKITRKAGISVKKNSCVNDLMPGEFGKSYYNGCYWVIIYDDSQPTAVSRFTVAHELGHFFLGHDLTYSRFENVQTIGTKSKAEQQADAFAMRLLTPACVLHALGIESAEEIAKTCGIPLPQAKMRSARIKELDSREKFFTDPLEKKVYDKFEPYIKKAIKKGKHSSRN